jgi:hypothetical protein
MLTKPGFSFRPPPEPFRGYIAGRRFKMTRVLGRIMGLPYRNSFQPVIVGLIEPAAGGTIIHLKMRLHAFVAAFMTIWFGFLFVFIGLVLWAGLRDGFGPAVVRGGRQDGAEGALAVAGGMLLFASLLVNVSFWMEVKKARVILCERLECREARPGNRLVRGTPAAS